jgi:hypothetical protein
MMKLNRLLLVAVALIVALGEAAVAQAAPAQSGGDEKGFTSYAQFAGTSNSDGQVYKLDPSLGYNFSGHFGMDVGIPFYFVRASSTTTGTTSTNGIGNPYVDMRVKFLNPLLNFSSVLTGYAPAGDSKKGLSTGHGTYDWTNHFDHSFSSLTPFAELGIANTVTDSALFTRPFTTFGFNTHLEGGAKYALWKIVSVGASGYDIIPSGQQTVFSKVHGGSSNSTSTSHKPVFLNNQQTTGTADIAHDDGFSTWIEGHPGQVVDLELGFTRSIHYDLNSVSFNIGLNLARLYRKSH